VNLLAGKEFKIGKEKRNAITFDMKMTTSGGQYYTPIDLDASRAAGEEVLFEDQPSPCVMTRISDWIPNLDFASTPGRKLSHRPSSWISRM
jgi:hypothetical protein